MAIYGNMIQNKVDISVLESSFDNEFNNFNRIMESINILNESGIILESVSLEKMIQTFKDLYRKFKEFIIKILRELKSKLSKNKTNTSTTIDRGEEIIKYTKFEIHSDFFNFNNEFISHYSEFLQLPLSGDHLNINLDDEQEVSKILNNSIEFEKRNPEIWKRFVDTANEVIQIEKTEEEDKRTNVVRYYKDIRLKMEKSENDVFNSITKISNNALNSYRNFLSDLEKSSSGSTAICTLLRIALTDMNRLKSVITIGNKYINKCHELIVTMNPILITN